MVTVDHLQKTFGSVRAVDEVSFTVKPGEVVGLLGPNGAGKSTTMRMMTGFLTPDRGSVTIDGISVTDNPIAAQELTGYLPENNPLYKDMLVSDLLAYSAALKGVSGLDLRDAIDFAVSSVGIAEVYHQPIGELSKGYKQRVGLAIALLKKPKILILDEPSEGLDPNQRSEIRALIRELSKNHTIIVSTHVMQEVEAVCSRMIIISKGRVVADGSPKELINKSGHGTVYIVDIEGKNVESKLKNLVGITTVESTKLRNGVISSKITCQKKMPFQPELSRIVAQNKWIIWKLTEEEQHLEDVFHALTEERV